MSSPLLLLFDGYLSQDQERVEQALEMITGEPSIDFEQVNLFATLGKYLQTNSHMAAIPNSHDGSLPLHFAASFGNVAVAELIWKHVRIAQGVQLVH
jgi:hypothetical protein